MGSNNKVIVWFRRDLRLRDNPALAEACKNADEVIPVFILSPEEEKPWEPGAASKWWLHHSLERLDADFRADDSKIILRRGPVAEALDDLIKESGVSAVYWNRLYEPVLVKRDKALEAGLQKQGIEVKSFASSLLAEPWDIKNKSGKPFQVFTPFWKTLSALYEHRTPLKKPTTLKPFAKKLKSLKLSELKLLPKMDWTDGLEEFWQPGERAARKALNKFSAAPYKDYSENRNLPDVSGTSLLSPHLHFGELSPRQVWDKINAQADKQGSSKGQFEPYLRQLGWREFGHHLLFHFPHTDLKPLREEFLKFPWKKNKRLLSAWQKGTTGYPLVDAGMRQLWHSGWMHNRVRMVVASFLVKDLLQPWPDGARWFWDTLVDASLANNTLGWQWTAGCGADAAPYFRVFNPVLQGERFDPNGDYVRRWVPELSKLPKKWIHRPREAPEEVLSQAGVELGKTYPEPMVDHAEARDDALDAYDELKSNKAKAA